MQTIKYKANSQPFYVLMNHDESNLIIIPILWGNMPENEMMRHNEHLKSFDSIRSMC